jgi:hypothetical protein
MAKHTGLIHAQGDRAAVIGDGPSGINVMENDTPKPGVHLLHLLCNLPDGHVFAKLKHNRLK